MRAQLEEYYASLTREKAREERRSLWRIQRMKLNRLRRAHLMLEMSNLNQELRQRLEGGGAPSTSHVTDPEVQEEESSDLGTASNPGTTPEPAVVEETVSTSDIVSTNETVSSSDAISASDAVSASEAVAADNISRTRKTWDQPININIDIAVVGNKNAELQNISVCSGVSENNNQNDTLTEDNVMKEQPNDNEATVDNAGDSDEDSEISFTLSPGNPADKTEQGGYDITKIRQSVTSEGSEFLSCHSEMDETEIPRTRPHVSRINSDGSDMRNVFYSASSQSIPEYHFESKYEPDGQMKDILYGEPETDDTGESKSNQPLSRLDSEGDIMRDILYSREKSDSDGVKGVKSKQPLSRLDSEGDDMRDILYSRSESNKSDVFKSKQPLSRLDSEGSEMKDILYSKPRSQSSESKDSRSKQPLSRLDSEGQEMKDILYSKQEPDKTVDTNLKQPLSRLDSEGQEMKDVLYSTSTPSKGHSVTEYEPPGQMKGLLYGEDLTSGYSSTKAGESETETELTEDSVTPTVAGKDSVVKSKKVQPVDRMKEILYGQPQTRLGADVEFEKNREVSRTSIGG